MTNITDNGLTVGEIERVEQRSVINRPDQPYQSSAESQVFWFLNQVSESIPSWGGQHKVRDMKLRAFITQENIFASALGIICSRNAGFSWKIDGPPRTSTAVQEMLESANMGLGWHDLIVKTTIDLSTQDNGAFWEIVRDGDSEKAPVIGINHLDSARCWHTGVARTPVLYQDRLGKFHILKSYQVQEFAEMPASIEQLGYYGLQYCALTRLLRKMETRRNIDIHDSEKTGGRNAQSIHLVKGITSQQLQDSITQAKSTADAIGLTRFMNPILVGTIDPKADVGHDTIDLVTMPEGWNTDTDLAHYINLISMAFATDYQEFAPLPGQKLGTGAQSEMLHLKSRGKGPGTFMKMITRAINFYIVPKNVKFIFNEQDLEAEKTDAEVRAIRAQTRAVRIASGEITPQVARQIANDEGDLKEEFIVLMGETDVTPDSTIDNSSTAQSQLPGPNVIKPGVPAPNASQAQPGAAGQPSRVPSIRPPTPIGPKGPASMMKNLKEYDGTMASIKERGRQILEILSA